MNIKNKRIKRKIDFTIEIFPWFRGFTDDLLFWAAINTIFLTTVKGLSAAQISSLTTIGNLISIVMYSIFYKIIKRIGNINSIKLGTFFLLISAVLMTFSNSYLIILFGYILYDSAFSFKTMENVVIRKNLKYKNREQDYIKIQSKSSLIYSVLTLIIAAISGFLFNFNNYLPMILCIIICIVNVITSNFLYEYKYKNEEQKINNKIQITKVMFLIFLINALVYATIDLGQSNTKLFIQYRLSSFLDITKVSIVFSGILFVSRIVRVVGNYILVKYYKEENKKFLNKIAFALTAAFTIIIIGSIIKLNYLGIGLMAIGFFVFLAIRDGFGNYTQTLLLNNCEEKYHEKAITYLTLARKIGKFVISTLITLTLLKVEMIYIIVILFLISIFNIFIIGKMYKLINEYKGIK